ncbi:MAG: AzlD domain-containing protein [Betaproteobacteria bacterium]|nr:AzlD domain-containing protein [Betaproteobacteria bacterium]
MEASFVWAVILALAAVTYFNRISFIGLLAHVELPRLMQRMLAYVPAAILAAIIAPLVFPAGVDHLPTLDWPRLIAALIAVTIALRTRGTLATICIGMLALWGMQALLA